MMDPLFLTRLGVVTLTLLPGIVPDAVPWDYSQRGSHGPGHWKDEFPDCGGVMQSPIDIDTSFVLHDPMLDYFDLSDYTKVKGVNMQLVNKAGHTAEVMMSGDPIYLRDGGLPDRYQLDQFHFHWGKVDGRGSEHTLNGEHFPMEMHLVHYQKHLKNVSAAAAHPYGLAVLGFFFEVGEENQKFDQLLDHFDAINAAGAYVDIPTFRVMDLLPPRPLYTDFYRYFGSLTTPPCYETVIWSLGLDTIEISERQLSKFRALHDAENHPLVDDFRPLQARNAREVTTTRSEGFIETGSGAAMPVWPKAALALGLAASSACNFL